jgi:hypothetical protein
MAITPTYSWPLPDDTDLVKDGAEAIRDLGNAIDTTVGGLSGAGLVHIETQTFSAVSAVSFSNDVFTSTYDNYKLMWYMESSTIAGNLNFRMRLAGTDNSTSTYGYSLTGRESTTTLGESNLSQTSGKIGEYSTGVACYTMDIYAPKLAVNTQIVSTGGRDSRRLVIVYGNQQSATSFDSISLLFSAGSVTGTAALYGYKK